MHTPGPWHRNIKPAKKYNTIFSGRNKHVCHLTVTGLSDEEIEDNCNLIMAAPDLLQTLKDAQEELRLIRMKDTNAVYDSTVRIRIELTIAKAEGKQ